MDPNAFLSSLAGSDMWKTVILMRQRRIEEVWCVMLGGKVKQHTKAEK
jgi:hypothetical protein